jgi:hypothetical protein
MGTEIGKKNLLGWDLKRVCWKRGLKWLGPGMKGPQILDPGMVGSEMVWYWYEEVRMGLY